MKKISKRSYILHRHVFLFFKTKTVLSFGKISPNTISPSLYYQSLVKTEIISKITMISIDKFCDWINKVKDLNQSVSLMDSSFRWKKYLFSIFLLVSSFRFPLWCFVLLRGFLSSFPPFLGCLKRFYWADTWGYILYCTGTCRLFLLRICWSYHLCPT